MAKGMVKSPNTCCACTHPAGPPSPAGPLPLPPSSRRPFCHPAPSIPLFPASPLGPLLSTLRAIPPPAPPIYSYTLKEINKIIMRVLY